MSPSASPNSIEAGKLAPGASAIADRKNTGRELNALADALERIARRDDAIDEDCPLTSRAIERLNGALKRMPNASDPEQHKGDTDSPAGRGQSPGRVSSEPHLGPWNASSAVTTLALGVAEDFNSIFGSIMGYTEVALLEWEEQGFRSAELAEVLRAAARGNDLVQRLLAFSRQGSTGQRRPIKLNTVISEALDVVDAQLPARIELAVTIPRVPCLAVIDAADLYQVVVNLCANASDAMAKHGGKLTVALGRIQLDSAKAAALGLPTGDFVQLAVSDTGSGMQADVSARVFEPFFTTKARGNGAGLGLAVVAGIVRRYGGAVRFDTQPDIGSTFSMLLPAPLRTPAKSRANLDLPTGTETVLFVDDEVSLARLGDRFLSRLGYKVLVRSSSVEALEAFKNCRAEVDLVITDQMMPNMTGIELAAEMRRMNPHLPIILATGYADDHALDCCVRELGITFLVSKPYLGSDLALMVRQALDERHAAAPAPGNASD